MDTDNIIHQITRKFVADFAILLDLPREEYKQCIEATIKTTIQKTPDIILAPKNKKYIHWIVEIHNYKDPQIYFKGLVMVSALKNKNKEIDYGCIILFFSRKQDLKKAKYRDIYNNSQYFKVLYLDEIIDKIREVNEELWLYFSMMLETEATIEANIKKSYASIIKSKKILAKEDTEVITYELLSQICKGEIKLLERLLEMIGVTKKHIKEWGKTSFGKMLIEQGMQEGEKRGIQKGEKRGIQKGKEEGMQEGEKRGIQKGMLEIALKMKKMGYPIEEIQKITGLSKQALEDL